MDERTVKADAPFASLSTISSMRRNDAGCMVEKALDSEVAVVLDFHGYHAALPLMKKRDSFFSCDSTP